MPDSAPGTNRRRKSWLRPATSCSRSLTLRSTACTGAPTTPRTRRFDRRLADHAVPRRDRKAASVRETEVEEDGGERAARAAVPLSELRPRVGRATAPAAGAPPITANPPERGGPAGSE